MRRAVGEVVTGAAAALVVFGAVPGVLIAFVGLPLPHHWTQTDVVSLHGAFDLLAVVAWVAWAACCWQLLRAVARQVRRREAATASGARVPEWLATRIAAAVLALVSIVGGLSASSGAQPTRAPTVVQTVGAAQHVVETTLPDAPSPPLPAGSTGTEGSLPSTYTVQAGDTLWSIAVSAYGDGGDWSAIAQANVDRVMTDGTRFVDPSLILPGWVLTLPPLGPGTSAASPESTSQQVVTEAASTNGTASVPSDPVRPAPAIDAAREGADRTPDSAPSRRRAPAVRHAPPGHRPGPSPVPLPELAALGFGTLAAAAFARRARRARHLSSLARLEGEDPEPVTAGAADTGALLAPFLGAPVLHRLELANRHLGAAVAGSALADHRVARLVVIGPNGVEVQLASPVDWAPGGWEPTDERTWLLPASADSGALAEAAATHGPWIPLLVPVGDDDRGTWLVPLGAGDILPVIGPEADAMVSAMRAVVESWSWAEGVVVTDDPAVVEHLSAEPTGTGGEVLFVGDPGNLTPGARARVAVVTTLAVPATDLTVVIDDRAASLHPLGLTVRPSLLRPAEHAALEDLVGPPLRTDDAASRSRPANGRRPPRPRPSPRALAAGPLVTVSAELFPSSLTEPSAHKAVQVRLLTAVPRIDGLVEPIDPKRARRATELVAYLSLHQPDPVTSDRLRTRVLGSADADAASKTLFNTVGAARRAMGQGPDGRPLLPPASKSGHYRVSSLVTTDVTRAEDLVAEADATEDEEEAIALLRASLDLVEGEPLAGTLTGYGWWGAEGHERRIAATLVDGACRLARLAADHGYLDLARWGLERARLVEPYSELLSRAAMRVAAEDGDAERLRREWLDCQRRVDEIDPGGLPSEATERLYADLRRRVPAHAGDVEA